MDWTRGQIIGHGSSATVFLASSSHSGDLFAVKSAELSQSESLQREQQLLSSLTCPHIVGYRGCDITRDNRDLVYNLFMEYVPGGSLADAIRRRGGRLDESLIGFYTRQLVQGLQYIHSKGLVHCDIKAGNVLICGDGAKLADFGCAKWVSQMAGAERVPIGGTPLFMAPEVARGEEQGLPCDIWALGCTIIEMATGGSPWPEVSDPVSALYRIGYSDELPETPPFLSHQAKDFLEKCLRRNPEERLIANQLLKHPFLGEFNSSPKQIQEVYSDSPTSILDPGIWSSTEEITQSEDNTVQTCPKSLPAEQIRRLSMLSGEPSWTEDENWITIRTHDIWKSDEVGGGDDEGDQADMIGGSAKVSSNYDVDDKQRGSGGKEWLEFIEKNGSCRISRNHLADHSCRKMSLVHNNLSSHSHRANFVSLMPSVL